MSREKQANRRIRLLLLVFGLVFAIAFARATWLQVVRASTLGKLAQRQHQETVVTPAARGTIFDAGGSPLAIGEQATTIDIHVSMIRSVPPGARVALRAEVLRKRSTVAFLRCEAQTVEDAAGTVAVATITKSISHHG